MAIATSISIVAIVMSILAFASALLCLRRAKGANTRLHNLERDNADLEDQLATVRRVLCSVIGSGNDEGRIASCHSQHGEELLIWKLLDFQPKGFFVEIGAYDGVSFSNSYFFEQVGWHGLLVEAHPELTEACRRNRPAADVIHAALGASDGGTVTFSMVRGPRGMDTLSFSETAATHRDRIGRRGGRIEQVEVPARSLSAVLDEREVTSIDWMSIDVEGAELSVLQGCDLQRFRPRLIVVEDNSAGADRTVANYLKKLGYEWETRCGCNDFFLRR